MTGFSATVDRGLDERERAVLSDLYTHGTRMPEGGTVIAYEALRSRFPESAVVSLIARGFLLEHSEGSVPRVSLNPLAESKFWDLVNCGVVIDLDAQRRPLRPEPSLLQAVSFSFAVND
jgi:hypothetical protein